MSTQSDEREPTMGKVGQAEEEGEEDEGAEGHGRSWP